MAKAAKVLCDRCESRISAGVSFCDHCHYPTQWASHEERTTWEVSQWKAASEPKAETAARRSGGFASRLIGRSLARKKATQPEWHLSLVPAPPAANLEAAAEAVAAEVFAPMITRDPVPTAKPVQKPMAEPALKTAVKPAVKPVAEPVATPVAPAPKRTEGVSRPVVEPRPTDDEPARDTPHTVLAMRLLNAKVAELHDRVARLERELAEARRERSFTR